MHCKGIIIQTDNKSVWKLKELTLEGALVPIVQVTDRVCWVVLIWQSQAVFSTSKAMAVYVKRMERFRTRTTSEQQVYLYYRPVTNIIVNMPPMSTQPANAAGYGMTFVLCWWDWLKPRAAFSCNRFLNPYSASMPQLRAGRVLLSWCLTLCCVVFRISPIYDSVTTEQYRCCCTCCALNKLPLVFSKE